MKTITPNYTFTAYPNGKDEEAFEEGSEYQVRDELAKAWEENSVVKIKGDVRKPEKADKDTETGA